MLKNGIRAFAILILVSSLGSCSWLKPRPQKTENIGVQIVAGTLDFSQDTVGVHTLDFIQWHNSFDGELVIEFESRNFMPYRQIIPPGGTGKIMIRSGTPLGIYKYDVTATIDGRTYTVDPWVDVEEEGDGDSGRGGDDNN